MSDAKPYTLEELNWPEKAPQYVVDRYRVRATVRALDEARARVAELQRTVHECCDGWQLRAEKAEARCAALKEKP